jgi:2OG-Fe(II) oxygenase superfamily
MHSSGSKTQDIVSASRVRIVTVFLRGGQVIKLGGAVDVASLIQRLRAPRGEEDVIEIRSDTEHFTLRCDALLGVLDGYAVNEAAPDDAFLVRPFTLIKEFLSPEDHHKVILRALEREQDFEISKVTSDIPDHRKSVLLRDDDVIGPMFRQRLQNVAPEIAISLGLTFDEIPSFREIECQITAHRDAGFYHVHNDSGSPDTATRVFSYVYYFQTRPHAFFGGELKLYQPMIENGIDVTGAEFFLIKPQDNSIVFFLATFCMRSYRPTFLQRPSETHVLQ